MSVTTVDRRGEQVLVAGGSELAAGDVERGGGVLDVEVGAFDELLGD